MSGFEVAGVTIAVLQLLISVAEHYDKFVVPFSRYRKFPRQARRFLEMLDIERVIFQNQCRNLLQDLVEDEVATCMLRAVDHPSWRDPLLEHKLTELLNKSKGACISVMREISERLQDIEPEYRDLIAVVQSGDTVGAMLAFSDGEPERAWRIRVTKLRFSLSKGRLDQSLKVLSVLNEKFCTLASQLKKSEKRQQQREFKGSEQVQKEIAKYNTVQKASWQVYEALRQACTKHTEQFAHTCTEVEYTILTNGRSPQVKFQMTLAGSVNQNEPISFIVNATLDDCIAEDDVGSIFNPEGFDHALKLHLEKSTESTAPKKTKSVHFKSNVAPSTSEGPSATTTKPFYLGSNFNEDFYDHLRRCRNEAIQPNVCVGSLGTTGEYKNSVFLVNGDDCPQRQQAISLGQLVSTFSEHKVIGVLPIYERLHLAKVLTVAVLQYHATPWLQTSWKSHDVVFFGMDLKSILQQKSGLTTPHLHARIERPGGLPTRDQLQTDCALGARNAMLYSLGIVLLELAYWRSWESLNRPEGELGRYADFFQARTLLKSGCSGMGPKYDLIVEKLIECDFACGDDLGANPLQTAVYRDVVCPLDKLEAGFRALQVGL